MKKQFILILLSLSVSMFAQQNIVVAEEVAELEEIIMSSFEDDPEYEIITVNSETEARYPGGDEAVERYLWQNKRYPKEALKNNITGTVSVEFTVRVDGTVGDAHVVKGGHPLLDAEAIRVVESMTKWAPATINSKPVESKRTHDVVFK